MIDMKKLLYISPTAINFAQLDGVQKKILNQSKAFVGFGYDVSILTYFGGKVLMYDVKSEKSVEIASGKSKIDVLRAVPKIIKGYDCVYIRYPMSDFIFIHALKSINKNGIPVVVEIPTYPYDTEHGKSLKGRIVDSMDRYFRKRLHKYVQRICTYSDDKEIFGIPTINTINGVDFSQYQLDYTPMDLKKSINLIAVSGMYIIHGYDRLIRGLGQYYSEGGKRNIVLNIVGSGNVENQYKELTEQFKLQEHVIFHGRKFGQELLDLYRGQALGVNSLAIHRANLVNESTLKTKEYAALGLPVISSSYVDAFSEEGNKRFALMVAPDESNININAIINFVDSVYSLPIKDVRDSIRCDAMAVCDMPVTLKPIYNFYKHTT